MAQDSSFADDDEVEMNDQEFRGGAATQGGGSPSVATAGGDDSVLVTREGLKKIQQELDVLKNVRRKEVVGRLKEAISYGDLSENSEYEEAKNEQAFVEGRIIELEHKIKHAKIIHSHHAKSVQIGTMVTLRRSGYKDAEVYTIVGTTEADPFENKISNESPIGLAIMDRLAGDKVEVATPSGSYKYEIVKLK